MLHLFELCQNVLLVLYDFNLHCPLTQRYSFLYDLQTECLIHKYVDDTTLTEIIHSRNDPCNMQNFFHQLLELGKH